MGVILSYKHGPLIAQCPKEVNEREMFGHRELDIVVSGRGKAKGFVVTWE